MLNFTSWLYIQRYFSVVFFFFMQSIELHKMIFAQRVFNISVGCKKKKQIVARGKKYRKNVTFVIPCHSLSLLLLLLLVLSYPIDQKKRGKVKKSL